MNKMYHSTSADEQFGNHTVIVERLMPEDSERSAIGRCLMEY
jgi:hypothetical protein